MDKHGKIRAAVFGQDQGADRCACAGQGCSGRQDSKEPRELENAVAWSCRLKGGIQFDARARGSEEKPL